MASVCIISKPVTGGEVSLQVVLENVDDGKNVTKYYCCTLFTQLMHVPAQALEQLAYSIINGHGSS